MPGIQNQNRRCNLVLHCGASAVKRADVARVSTPRPTETWQPSCGLKFDIRAMGRDLDRWLSSPTGRAWSGLKSSHWRRGLLS
jgi:hypothetical protein